MMTIRASTKKNKPKRPAQRKIGFFEFFLGCIRFFVFNLPVLLRNKKFLFDVDQPIHLSIGWFIETNAQRYPDNPALVFEGRTWTHQEFNEEVNRLSNTLLALDIKRGDVFVVLLENRPETLFCLGAAAKIGAIASMINFNLRGKALLHCLTICPCKAYIVGEELMNAFEEVKSDLPHISVTPVLCMTDTKKNPVPADCQDLKRNMAGSSADNPLTTSDVLTSDAYAYVFTSGTTGMPKAAPQYHRSWIRSGASMGTALLKINRKDRVYVCLPFFHVNPLKVGWGLAHVNGAAIIMTRKFSVSRFWDDIRKYKVTAFNYIGELCTYLINQPEKPDDADHSVRAICGNGLRPDLFHVFKKRFKIKKIIEGYSASELDFGFVNALNLDATIGFATPPKNIALVKYNAENDNLERDTDGYLVKVKKGEPGILLCKAKDSVIVSGYTSKEATERKIIYNAFEKNDCWFNTGDLIRNIGFGHHQFVDRTGDTFRWKGENVSTMEVEKIANSFKQVKQSTSYGVKVGNGDGRIGMISIVTHTPLQEFDLEGLGRLLVDALPAYAVPRFLRLKTDFETTATFKIKKNTLRDQGFDVNKCNDPIFVMLPGEMFYQPLTPKIYSEIFNGDWRF